MFAKSERNAKTSSMGLSIGMVFSNSSTSSSFSQIGTIMPSKEVGCIPRESYSPECVEGEFSEVHFEDVGVQPRCRCLYLCVTAPKPGGGSDAANHFPRI